MFVRKGDFFMQNLKKVSFNGKNMSLRLTLDAIFAALYIVFGSFLTVRLPFAEFSLASLPILLCGFAFGPIDALAVSVCGAFAEQLMYGLSPTSPIWMLPAILQGVYAGLVLYAMRKNPKPLRIAVAVVIGELLLTAANTAALYLDAKIIGYSVKALYLLLPTRLASAGIRMVVTVPLVVALCPKLRKICGIRLSE